MRRLPLAFIALMVLVALNFRPALSSLAPVLLRLQADLGLSAVEVGVMTTLPVFCLGLFAPAAPWLARRVGYERTLTLALLGLSLALLLRSVPVSGLQYLATALVGAAIGVGGTVLPVLVKREVPGAPDLVTGVYTMALCLGGALGAGLSVPLADGLGGWPAGLASWSLLALVGLVAWISGRPRPVEALPATGAPAVEQTLRLRRSPLAWQVTVLMGSQSSLAYVVFGWLPALLQQRGASEALAGWMMAVSVFVQLFAALLAPWFARLFRDQRPTLLLMLGMTALGFTLLMLAGPEWRWAGVVALGIGQGGSFSLALTLIVLRTANPVLAARLSSMAQGFGYCLAALGPLGVGVMLGVGVSITGLWGAFIGVLAIAAVAGTLAGRDLCLDQSREGELVLRRGARGRA